MLNSGTRLGAYEIESLVGAGGMGEVYCARDSRLDRTVAIKILPIELSSDPDLRDRFQREARTISQLDHAHICAIHDIGRHEGIDYLVLEYLQGETLAQRLTKGALSLDRALTIAQEIASALEAAHRRHIVHRDLKPGNVMLTKSGTKLLDFGLAKPLSPITSGVAGASVLPTAAAPLTVHGTILGTLQYMAPEQLEGREADARTDIFAFGAILYEMLTGRRPFEGKSQASLIAAILEHQPQSIESFVPLVPPLFDSVVRRCLEKDPDHRWQSVQDLALALKLVADQRAVVAPARMVAPSQWRAWLAMTAVLWAALATALVIYLWTRPRLPVASEVSMPAAQFIIGGPPALSPGLATPTVAMAANGSVLVYVGRENGINRLYLRRLSDSTTSPIAGTEEAVNPFVSPDGKWAGYTQLGRLKKVSLDGGTPVTVADVVAARGITSAPDDALIYSSGTDSGLWRMPAAGGVPVQLTRPDAAKGERSHRWPFVLPGGTGVLYTIARSDIQSFDDAAIAVHSLTTGVSTELLRGGSFPMFVTGHLLYSRAGALLAAPFDATTLKITGPSTTVRTGIVTYPSTGAAQVAVSNSGALVFMAGGATEHHTAVVTVDRTGRATNIPFPPALFQRFKVSPDGKSIALDIDNANASIWIGDIERATARRLTLAWSNNGPVWSPDGTRVAFSSGRGGARNLFLQPIDGTQPERLTTAEHNQTVTSWSSDGRYLLFSDQTASAPRDVMLLDLQDGRTVKPLINTAFDDWGAEFSPDMKWIAYAGNESGSPEVYIQTFPDLKRKTKVSRDGGTLPVWSRDGKELYYRSRDALMAVGVTTDAAIPVSVPRLLFRRSTEFQPYDVLPDGRFLVIDDVDPVQSLAPLTVALNWFDATRMKKN